MSEKELKNSDTNLDKITEVEEKSSQKSFVKARDKYSDMKSSALCLFIISIAGLIITVLDCLNMLPIKLNSNSSWIFYFAMYALYIIFFIVGICTLRSAKKIKSTISDEESQTDTIVAWAMDNLTADYIDNKCRETRANLIEKEQYILEKLSEEEDSDEKDAKSTFEKTEPFDDIPEELKCFDREDVIASEIKKQFDIDDDSYISSILEEIYPEIYE